MLWLIVLALNLAVTEGNARSAEICRMLGTVAQRRVEHLGRYRCRMEAAPGVFVEFKVQE